MFHDTIRANLCYARPEATEEELIAACRAAQIWDLVASLPDGLNTVVGDRGYRLSGGEKQRLAIARLLLKAPVRGGPRRGHRAPGLGVRGGRAGGAEDRADRPDLAGHRAPAVHDPGSGPDPGHRRRAGAGARHATRNCSPPGGLYAELYHTQFAGQEPAANRSADRGELASLAWRGSDDPERAAVDREHRPGQVAGRGGQHEGGGPPELGGLADAAQRDAVRHRTAGRPRSSRSRSVAIHPGSSPFTRIPRGPSSSARVFATPGQAGTQPIGMASEEIGTRTDDESTNAIDPPSVSSAASARHSRTARGRCFRTRPATPRPGVTRPPRRPGLRRRRSRGRGCRR